jgi:hypothetical protein
LGQCHFFVSHAFGARIVDGDFGDEIRALFQFGRTDSCAVGGFVGDIDFQIFGGSRLVADLGLTCQN